MIHDATTPQTPSTPADAKAPAERGSALIVSMMIMVILTMLGVTFLVLAEQEAKIAVNSRDHEQTLYAAEAAVEIAKSWFNDPSASTNLTKPADNQMRYSLRKGAIFREDWTNELELAAAATHSHSNVNGSSGNVYTGGTLGGGVSRFDKPFRGAYSYGLWGRQDTPDVLLCGDLTLDVDGNGSVDCDATMATYMTKLNRALAMGTNLRNAGHSSRDVGVLEIEQIRVYRPPIDFNLHNRFGIATIEATAIKRVRSQIVARRTVREVIQEIPFPGPSGAIESEGEISAQGSAGVHWGSVVSSSTNDDISLPGTNANFPDASVARSSSARWGFHHTINPAGYSNHGGQGTALGQDVIATFLTEALGITRSGVAQGTTAAAGANAFEPPGIGDPWLLFRARRRILISGTPLPTGVQPHPYSAFPAGIRIGEFDKGVNRNWSHMWQSQIVRFPPMDYQIWKDVAQSGQNGMFYFEWDAGVNYRRDGAGASQSFTTWLEQLNTGVFFFDTKDSSRPLPDESNLTDSHGWGTNMYVEGFIYLNADTFDSSGCGNGTATECNMPGEVFLDDGIDLHPTGDAAGDNCICIRFDQEEGCVLGVRPIGYPTCTRNQMLTGDACPCPPALLEDINDDPDEFTNAQREAETFRNGVWDSDINNDGISEAGADLTSGYGSNYTDFISNNEGVNEGMTGGHGYNKGVLPGYGFPRRYRQGQIFPPTPGTIPGVYDWKRDPRFLNYTAEAGWNATTGRKVHEPFLNFDSPSTTGTVETWANSHSVKVNFRGESEPVERNAGGTIVKTTTKSRDATGALMSLDLHMNGVFYCEGVYEGTGNLNVYGSLLMRGGYSGTGSVDVWFNEDLVKGKFPPTKWKLPRVYSSARDTN